MGNRPRQLPEIKADFPVWNLPGMLRAYVDYPDRQSEILEQTRHEMLFMQEHDLLVRPLIDPNAPADALRTFILRWGDLTPEGQEFFRRTEIKGLKIERRGKSVRGLKMYERELKKLRAERGNPSS